MSQARFTSTGRAYGLKRVCALWGLARSTVYAQRRREAVPVHERPTPNKRGPVGPCTDAEPRPHPAGPGGLSLPWRGLPQGVGEAALRGHPHQQGAGASPDAGGGASGPPPGGQTPRSQGPQRDHPHRAARPNVGHGHDDDGDHRGGDGLGVRGGGSLLGGLRGDPCGRAATASRPWSRSGRGSPSASPAWRRTSPRGLKFVTTTAPPICPMTFSGRSPTWA